MSQFTIVDCNSDRMSAKTSHPLFCSTAGGPEIKHYSRILFLTNENGGFYLYTYDWQYHYLADTYHSTEEEAKRQALLDYGQQHNSWVQVPSLFGKEVDWMDYAKTVLCI